MKKTLLLSTVALVFTSWISAFAATHPSIILKCNAAMGTNGGCPAYYDVKRNKDGVTTRINISVTKDGNGFARAVTYSPNVTTFDVGTGLVITFPAYAFGTQNKKDIYDYFWLQKSGNVDVKYTRAGASAPVNAYFSGDLLLAYRDFAYVNNIATVTVTPETGIIAAP